MEDNSKNISAKKVLWISFIVDLIDVITGIVVTILSGSIIMLSQVLEGFADLASSGLLVFGLNRSQRKADSEHPFGYGRELYFWTLISALIMLAITATFTIHLGWERLMHPQQLANTGLADIVLILTFFTNGYALSLSIKRLLSKKPLSKIWSVFFESSLIETKTSFVLDLMGTSASLLGFIALLLLRITGDNHFDGLGAISIGLSLGVFAFLLLIATKDFLIGKSVSQSTIHRIKKAVHRTEGINSVQDLKATHMGPDILINIEINAKDNLTTNELEKIIDNVKDEIRKDIPQANHIQVELES